MIYYASNLIEKEKDYDSFDTKYIKEIVLQERKIESVEKTYNLQFEFGLDNYNKDNEEIYILLTEQITNFKKKFILEGQKLVDDFYSTCVVNKDITDYCDSVKAAKDSLTSSFSDYLLNDLNIMVFDTDYNVFGYILSGDSKVATFEKAKFDSSNITVSDIYSSVNIENVDDLSIELYFDSYKKTIKNVELTENLENINVFEYSSDDIESEKVEEKLNIKKRFDFASEEEYIEDRRNKLNIEISNRAFDVSEFDDMFN